MACSGPLRDEFGMPDNIGSGVWRRDRQARLPRVVALPTGRACVNRSGIPRRTALHVRLRRPARYWRACVGSGQAQPTHALGIGRPVGGPIPRSASMASPSAAKRLYGIVYDAGRVVRIPVTCRCAAGSVSVVTQDPRLVQGDGVGLRRARPPVGRHQRVGSHAQRWNLPRLALAAPSPRSRAIRLAAITRRSRCRAHALHGDHAVRAQAAPTTAHEDDGPANVIALPV